MNTSCLSYSTVFSPATDSSAFHMSSDGVVFSFPYAHRTTEWFCFSTVSGRLESCAYRRRARETNRDPAV